MTETRYEREESGKQEIQPALKSQSSFDGLPGQEGKNPKRQSAVRFADQIDKTSEEDEEEHRDKINPSGLSAARTISEADDTQSASVTDPRARDSSRMEKTSKSSPTETMTKGKTGSVTIDSPSNSEDEDETSYADKARLTQQENVGGDSPEMGKPK